MDEAAALGKRAGCPRGDSTNLSGQGMPDPTKGINQIKGLSEVSFLLQGFEHPQWWEGQPDRAVSAQQDVGARGEGWPQPRSRRRRRGAGADELRGTRARRLRASAKHWGHPELLEQHISSLSQLKSVLSVLR